MGHLPLVSQSYEDGDEFQEFGLRWAGKGFTYTSSPGWHFPNKPLLEDFNLDNFAGVAKVIDLTDRAKSGFITAGDFTDKIGLGPLPKITVLKTGHADEIPLRRREYWTQAPQIAPAIAEIAAEEVFHTSSSIYPVTVLKAEEKILLKVFIILIQSLEIGHTYLG